MPIPMPVSEPGDWLDAPDLVYVNDLPEGAERDRVEKVLNERRAAFKDSQARLWQSG